MQLICPECKSDFVQFNYGGERGEKGPYLFCKKCGYDEEENKMNEEFGYDPNKTYIISDNEFWDGTDVAHPAWWRGEEYSFHECCRIIKKVLDGNKCHTRYQEPLQSIIDEIKNLMEFKWMYKGLLD